eukprot:TRINITY_DN11_c0_g1_i2.p1 TRINITY_DN11_c0_g1~~TRINITY_DN11_c0_g1_i2.p1  ORF type:complete len:445 (-),score=106.82 TRINITY_DN11_c0_g1_i2:383-1717(-)
MVGIDVELDYLKKEHICEHLNKIVESVVAEKPADAHGLVEVISRIVKGAADAVSSVEPTEHETTLGTLADHVKKLRQLDNTPKEEDAPVQVCAIPDFVGDAEMLSWTGLGLGEMESYKVMCSLRNLAFKERDAGINKLSFWGKILGADADYYVAQAQREGGGGDDEGEDGDPDAEPSGTGANLFTYYVTNDLAGDWRRLPNIKPKEIIASRNIKRMFSGNAGAKVITHPFFEGTEEVLLRAQIARISADTMLCISGSLKREDDEDPASAIVQNEEFQCPSSAELLKKAAWMHMQPHILLSGRTTHKELPEEGETDEEKAVLAKAKEDQAADPARDMLRSLESDGLAWSIKQVGDATQYKSSPDPAVPIKSDCLTYVRSLTWPGAVCAMRNGHGANIYVGYGIAATEPSFFPQAPPDVQDEPEDPGEQDEPRGTPAEEEAPKEEE